VSLYKNQHYSFSFIFKRVEETLAKPNDGKHDYDGARQKQILFSQ